MFAAIAVAAAANAVAVSQARHQEWQRRYDAADPQTKLFMLQQKQHAETIQAMNRIAECQKQKPDDTGFFRGFIWGAILGN